MRRPLCVFCAGTLGLELVCAFLPQTGRFVPFAAFLLPVCCGRWQAVCAKSGLGLWHLPDPGGSAGPCADRLHAGKMGKAPDRLRWPQCPAGGGGGEHRPFLFSRQSAGGPAGGNGGSGGGLLRVECASLPTCSPGDRVKGRFALETPDDTARLNACRWHCPERCL